MKRPAYLTAAAGAYANTVMYPITTTGTNPTSIIYWSSTAPTATTNTTNCWDDSDDSDTWIYDGKASTIHLPDGSVIDVAIDGSFTINDADAKVTYRANRFREFNSFINASDKLEAFIKFCGAVGVKQSEMLDLPVKHFIAWLIVEAARADGEDQQHLQLASELKPARRIGRNRRRRWRRRRR